MKILNEQVKRDIAEKKLLSLDLGSGNNKKPGCYGIEILPLEGVDIAADLNQPLSLLPDNSVEYVYSSNLFEHISDLTGLLKELRRVTVKDGTIEIIVPHFSNPAGYSDPTHVRFFGLFSMYYFVDVEKQPEIRRVPCYYPDIKFTVESIKISRLESGLFEKVFLLFLNKFINKNIKRQYWYEKRFCYWYPATRIAYIMHPDK